MQGIDTFIPTEKKVEYIQALLEVGFDTIDFGSFVSPKAVPQMKDTKEVVDQLDLTNSVSRLLAIVANLRGAKEAVEFDKIHYLGFPLSISETFQHRNTNQSIVEALNLLNEIQEICVARGKELVVYISMGFGNPYGDPYDRDVVLQFAGILNALEIKTISLADTVGTADEDSIRFLFSTLIPEYPDIEFGAHLHSHPKGAAEKIRFAWESGCRRFDGAIKGYGGCPMADDDLVGNMATEVIYQTLKQEDDPPVLDDDAFAAAIALSSEVFPQS